MPALGYSPVPPRSSPSRTPPRPRVRLPRNTKFTFDLPPPTVLVPQFPTFKATFKHWTALLERRDLDASERTDEMTDYDYWPEFEGRSGTLEYSFDEEHKMRWNARTMREGAFERYRRVTGKFTPQRRIEQWVQKQASVGDYEDTVSPVKARIRVSPEVRKSMEDAARQVAAKRAQAAYAANLAKAKQDAKLGENARPKRKSSPRSKPLKVVDFAGPRTRSSGSKPAAPAPAILAQHVLAPKQKVAVRQPLTPARPTAGKRKLAEVPAAEEGRLFKKARPAPQPKKPQPTAEERQARRTRLHATLLAGFEAGGEEPLRPRAPNAAKAESSAQTIVAVAEPAVMKPEAAHPARAETKRRVLRGAAFHAALERALEEDPYGETGKLMIAQAQRNNAKTEEERAAADKAVRAAEAAFLPMPAQPKQSGPATRLRTRAAAAAEARKLNQPAQTSEDLRCPGCKHLFAKPQTLKRHRENERAKAGCRI